MVKKTKPTAEDLGLAADKLQYWIYDFYLDGHDSGFKARFMRLNECLLESGVRPTPNHCSRLVIVPTAFTYDKATLDQHYETYLENGFEGQIVRILDTPYQHKRTKYLLKRKEFVDKEFTILGVVEGIGNRAGTVGKFEFRTEAGERFHSNVKGSMKYIRKLWRNRAELIGKSATIKYFALTPDKQIPRFPYVIKIDREAYE